MRGCLRPPAHHNNTPTPPLLSSPFVSSLSTSFATTATDRRRKGILSPTRRVSLLVFSCLSESIPFRELESTCAMSRIWQLDSRLQD